MEYYQIRVKGHIKNLTEWFDGLIITLEKNGESLLSGPITDQAALYGLLKKINDLGMDLVSVVPKKPTGQG